jgi:hypothetical protein
MRNLAKLVVGLSAVAFCLAVVSKYVAIMSITPGTYGRASLGLAALAIALVVVFEGPSTGTSGQK